MILMVIAINRFNVTDIGEGGPSDYPNSAICKRLLSQFTNYTLFITTKFVVKN